MVSQLNLAASSEDRHSLSFTRLHFDIEICLWADVQVVLALMRQVEGAVVGERAGGRGGRHEGARRVPGAGLVRCVRGVAGGACVRCLGGVLSFKAGSLGGRLPFSTPVSELRQPLQQLSVEELL
ncbi:unnamed protein product [Parnassius apollo]|uniref:(apollo) hypothetical protein n=1 Tax=Parnassius apollo TaxID=110799 RepID=A0A8S3YFL4_PARAO|nr:unnamed protein product [Parnassius apollo]